MPKRYPSAVYRAFPRPCEFQLRHPHQLSRIRPGFSFKRVYSIVSITNPTAWLDGRQCQSEDVTTTTATGWRLVTADGTRSFSCHPRVARKGTSPRTGAYGVTGLVLRPPGALSAGRSTTGLALCTPGRSRYGLVLLACQVLFARRRRRAVPRASGVFPVLL